MTEQNKTSGDGMETLVGEIVTLFCQIYIYTGKLVAVGTDSVLLENPSIVYETGPFDEKNWRDAQALPNKIWVMKNAIECYGIVKQ